MATTCKLIAKSTLGSSASNIEFTSIPATYTDLLILCSLRTDRANATDVVKLRFNGAANDTNLSSRIMYGTGSSATSESYSYAYVFLTCGANATADTFGNSALYIPNYAGSTNKSISSESASENNASTGYNFAGASLWSDTAAITSIKLFPGIGTNFATNSSAFLYGITKA
jgi:hypothetical protein